MLLFTAFLEEMGCIKKLKVKKMDLSPLIFFSIEGQILVFVKQNYLKVLNLTYVKGTADTNRSQE